MSFKGCQYPIQKTPQGLLPIQKGVDVFKSDLLQLLLTNPHERVMLPGFGTPLRKYFFQPNDITTTNEIREIIINSINAWEPRLVINAIDITNALENSSANKFDDMTESESVLNIRIEFFDPQEIQNIQELVLQVPLAGE